MTIELSVVLPVYNGLPFLGPAIESVLKQSHEDFECIIINDGSSDGSAEVIDDFARRDGRIRVVHQDNEGLVTALNRGLSLAGAPLIARMDADDIAMPNRLALQIAYLRDRSDVAVLGTSLTIIDKAGLQVGQLAYPVGPIRVAERLKHGCAIAHPTVMMRREAVLNVGGYRDNYPHAEDYDLWLRILEHYEIDNLPDALLHYRRHEDQVSSHYVVRQVVTAAFVREAARRRAAGEPEPVLNSDVVDEAALEHLRLRPAEEAEVRVSLLNELVVANAEVCDEGRAAIISNLTWIQTNRPEFLRRQDLRLLYLRLARRFLSLGQVKLGSQAAGRAFRGNPWRALSALFSLLNDFRHAR